MYLCTMERRMMITADGSPTLFVPELNETYHSTYGAVAEAEHVYIDAGLYYMIDRLEEQGSKAKEYDLTTWPEINVLEVGFGTGLNALLTLTASGAACARVYYEALEKFPLSKEEAKKLSYLSSDVELEWLHACDWEVPVDVKLKYIDQWWVPGNWLLPVDVESHFALCKRKVDLLDYRPECKFDVIYFDAFAPSVQPELWTESVFCKMYDALAPGGILVTYSAAGPVKAAMRAAGFTLERLSGAAGKRHMLRAHK